MIALSSGILLAALALPQQDGAATLAKKNADAARAITKEFSLDYWSEKLLERSLAETTSPEGRSELLLARCDVLLLKAQRKVNDADRLPALGAAGSAYVDFLDSSPGAERTSLAQTQLGGLSSTYGRTLVRLIDGGELDGTAKDEAIATAENIFKTSLKGMNSVIDYWEALDDDGEEKNLTRYSVYFPTVFNRAMVYLYWAQLYPAGSLEREDRANRAADYLGDFALGAPFFPAQRAYCAVGDCYVALGEFEDANDYYSYVLDNIELAKNDSDSTLEPGDIDLADSIVQQALLSQMRMHLQSGQTAQFWESYHGMVDWVDAERVTLTRDGYQAMLIAAEQMIADGDPIGAIELSDMVAKENATNSMRLTANSVMGRAIAAAPADAAIPLDVLFGAAQGAYFQKEYADAVDGFRLLIPRLAGHTRESEFGASSYYFLGLSWNQLRQPMLAAVTHQIGYESYPDDSDYAHKNAEKWQKLATQFSDRAPEDTALQAFNDEAVAAAQRAGIGSDDLQFDQAKKAHDQAKRLAKEKADGGKILRAYDKAIRAYEAVDPAIPSHEKALLQIAICHYERIPYDEMTAGEAQAAFDEYLTVYLADPANQPTDPVERKIRRESEPTAVFYLGRTYREMAKRGDASAWNKVLSTYEDFVSTYPDQPALGHAAMSYRVEAFLRIASVDSALAEYQAMLDLPAEKSRLSIAAYFLYSHFGKVLEGDMEGPQRIELTGLQARYLSDYNRFARAPRFQNLVIEGDLWASLGDFSKSAVLFQRVLDDHSKAQGFDAPMEFKVRMGLIESLLQTRKLGQAVPLVEAVMKEKPNNFRVMNAVVKVKAGFLVYENGKIFEVPGEGTAESLELATEMVTKLVKIAKNNAGKEDPPLNYYSFAPWWEAKLMQGYVLYQRNLTIPGDAGAHRTMVQGLERQAPQLGEDIVGERMSASLRWLLSR